MSHDTSPQGFLLGRNATLICLGDSITQAQDGYVTVMRNLITAAYPERNIRVINAGIGGHKAPDMLARLHRDVIAHKPNCVTIHVGINDVWHGFDADHPLGDGPNGVSLEIYEAAVTEMVDTLREATDAEIVLLTPTVIGEDVDNPDNRANAQLKDYAAAMQRISESRKTLLVPLHDDFLRTIRAGTAVNPDFRLTTDGVHLNAIGNHVLALSVLFTLGFAS